MPNTIAQNLQRLIDAKDAISSAITEKGGTIGVNDGLEEFPAAIATIPSGGSDLLGSFLLTLDRFNVNLNDKELVYNQSSAMTNNTGGYIAPATIVHYNGSWEWCITYRPRFSASSAVCILGTASSGRYYDNPTIELTGLTSVWIGVSSSGSTWDTGFSLSDFIEPMAVGTAYSFVLGCSSDGNAYAKVINAESGVVLCESTGTGYSQHHNSGNYKAALLGNAMQSRFMLAGDVVLSKTYYKEDGEVIWGAIESSPVTTQYTGTFVSPLRLWDTSFIETGFAPKAVAVTVYDHVNELNTYSVVYGITNGNQDGEYFQDGGYKRSYTANNTSGTAQNKKGHIIGTSENGFTFQVCEDYFANKTVRYIAIGVENNL